MLGTKRTIWPKKNKKEKNKNGLSQVALRNLRMVPGRPLRPEAVRRLVRCHAATLPTLMFLFISAASKNTREPLRLEQLVLGNNLVLGDEIWLQLGALGISDRLGQDICSSKTGVALPHGCG